MYNSAYLSEKLRQCISQKTILQKFTYNFNWRCECFPCFKMAEITARRLIAEVSNMVVIYIGIIHIKRYTFVKKTLQAQTLNNKNNPAVLLSDPGTPRNKIISNSYRVTPRDFENLTYHQLYSNSLTFMTGVIMSGHFLRPPNMLEHFSLKKYSFSQPSKSHTPNMLTCNQCQTPNMFIFPKFQTPNMYMITPVIKVNEFFPPPPPPVGFTGSTVATQFAGKPCPTNSFETTFYYGSGTI